MFLSQTFLASFLALLVQKTTAFNCSIPPVYVDIHRRAVHGTDAFQYGSFIGFGSPSQNQSLWPSLSRNETTIAATSFCDDSTRKDCRDATGGNYDVTASRSWAQDSAFTSKDLPNQFNSSITGVDVIHLYTHFFEPDPASQHVVEEFPLMIATGDPADPGVVGVGLSSNVLQGMYDDGLIAGRTYSLYIGSGFNRAGGVVNGSNTFGGYDVGRFKGPVHSYRMSPGSADVLGVMIADIRLDDPTDSNENISLFDRSRFPNTKSASFDAKITTDQYPMSFPSDITENFKSALAAVTSTSPDGSLALSKPYNGTMTIVLSDGFSITLASEVMYNASSLSPVAASSSSDSPFYLGSSFLSQVYLMLDYDSYSFHLAQAVPKNAYVMPRTWCPKTVPVPYEKPKISSFKANGGIGAVIGGVVGGIAGSLVVWYLVRRWYWRRVAKRESAASAAEKARMQDFESGSGGSEDGVGGMGQGNGRSFGIRRFGK